MNPFLVLSPGGFIDRHSLEITVKSFARLFHNVTPKHQRRLRLVLIEEKDRFSNLNQLLNQENICQAVKIIDREDVESTEAAYQNASLFLYPSKNQIFKIIQEALSFGLPVLTFEHPDAKLLLDTTCSMLLQKRVRNHPCDEFSRMLEMLYFDPEVKKILSKGAKFKYDNQLKWGIGPKQQAS